jgi:DNA-binding beta-propeller fold protein YncE
MTGRCRNLGRTSIWSTATIGILLLAANIAAAQTPSPALLVLEKSDNTLAIVDPANLQIVARVPAGPDPHEIVASADGKLAYISNYGGSDSALNTITVIDLAGRKALPPISLGALRSAHGLAFAGGKLYFTAETNKVIGRYDPATQSVDWVLGTGQDRTHMVAVAESLDRIVTSNVSSGTISIIEQISPPAGGFGPPPGSNSPQGSALPAGGPPPGGLPPGMGPQPGGPRKTWRVTNVAAGHGAEGFDVSPDGKEIWAANAQDATVTIIDAASKRVSQTLPISVRGANRLKFTPDGKRVLIAGLGAGTGSNFVVLDAATRTEVKQFNLGGGAAGIVIVSDGSHAYVAVSGKDKVAVVDLKSLEVTGYVSTGKQPDGLAWVQ